MSESTVPHLIKATRYKKFLKDCRKAGLVPDEAYPGTFKATCYRCQHDVVLAPTSAFAISLGFLPVCGPCFKPSDWTDETFILATSEQADELERFEAIKNGVETKRGGSVQ